MRRTDFKVKYQRCVTFWLNQKLHSYLWLRHFTALIEISIDINTRFLTNRITDRLANTTLSHNTEAGFLYGWVYQDWLQLKLSCAGFWAALRRCVCVWSKCPCHSKQTERGLKYLPRAVQVKLDLMSHWVLMENLCVNDIAVVTDLSGCYAACSKRWRADLWTTTAGIKGT